ncbi:DUF938 domain-containing protein [Spirulina sp. 06S082]|uniref:DUF938 domain-containing protein n=1 Tax=Spirulina sp. 06S082 TaxID=3110248 RepID=UPI002B1F1DCC|nr:DUF938 domain-containing protein [Spirulina sp. 06S082]MEA5471812.1 DUF938 domain-containing protein [Spirulina sp. 06S082]
MTIDVNPEQRKYAAATLRNRQPILEVLQEVLPPRGTVLEIASGTGEHSIYFAPNLQPRKWLPSEPNPVMRLSIEAWRSHSPSPNLYPVIDLNVCDRPWPIEGEGTTQEQFDFSTDPITAIVNINMIHISPWEACLGLMAGAGRILPPKGILYLYGPYKRDGQHTASSNQEFDRSLRSRHPEWGVRDIEAVIAAARVENLTFLKTVEMPANNLSVIFQRELNH